LDNALIVRKIFSNMYHILHSPQPSSQLTLEAADDNFSTFKKVPKV